MVLYIFHCLSGYVHRTVCNANSQVMRMALSWSSENAAVGTALRFSGYRTLGSICWSLRSIWAFAAARAVLVGRPRLQTQVNAQDTFRSALCLCTRAEGLCSYINSCSPTSGGRSRQQETRRPPRQVYAGQYFLSRLINARLTSHDQSYVRSTC